MDYTITDLIADIQRDMDLLGITPNQAKYAWTIGKSKIIDILSDKSRAEVDAYLKRLENA